MTFVLSGFADEISPDPAEQLAVLAKESITHLEFRGAWSTNVADLDDAHLASFRAALDDAGVSVSAIGSPIGKIGIGDAFEPEKDRLRRIADVAHELGTSLVRVFSFFIPAGEPPERYRQQVIDRLAELTEIAAASGLVLAHENEKLIYGDTPQRCADLITAIDSPALRATFDAANFVQCGVRPHSEGFDLLRPHLEYVQIKDAIAATGQVVPAGKGDGEVRETLAALASEGFDGYLSLEPHLAAAGQFGGYSGPDGFRTAARALKDLLAELPATWS
ncbi:MAG TPA: sugar phosphate isomerase/epimerase family protein [Streptosporangiaceae bacterium]|jgi:sugar phosphate isomerase/epimerase|nr:sugar phosphate isomerase/epimerase family protein [Streptosporangiaceae bacterium]